MGSLRQAHQAVTRECAEKLALGDAVVIFPEGTRVAHDAPLELASGGVRLACATRCRCAGRSRCGQGLAGERWPDRPGHIRVIVTPTLPPDCTIPQELNRLAQVQMDEALAELR